jgi:beta-galactosidase
MELAGRLALQPLLDRRVTGWRRLCATGLFATALFALTSVFAAEVKPEWDLASAERSVTATRDAVTLNSLWEAEPVTGEDAPDQPPREFHFWLKVPGVWGRRDGADVLAKEDLQPVTSLQDVPLNRLARLWLRRTFVCPNNWQGRRVALRCESVGERLLVFVDGQEAGSLRRSGTVDISSWIKPGIEQELVLLVDARKIPPERLAAELNEAEKKTDTVVGFGAGAEWGDKEKLAISPFPGVIADLMLESRPADVYLEHAEIVTSWQRKRLSVVGRLVNAGKADFYGRIRFSAFRGETTELTFRGEEVRIPAGDTVDFHSDASWENPSPWSPDTPNLYQGRIEVLAGNEQPVDVWDARFGFRELVVDGRGYRLNGKWIRLYGDTQNAPAYLASEDPESVRAFFRYMKSLGHNCYPTDFSVLGANLEDIQYRMRSDRFYEIADEEGILVTLSLPCFIRQEVKDYLENPTYQERLHRLVRTWLERYGQHACVAKLRSPRAVSTGYPNWTNPQCLSGYQTGYAHEYPRRQRDAALRLRAFVRSIDPGGRPLNNGGGDYDGFVTAYHYPNFGIPVQELADWPSRWATEGQKPLVLEEGDFTGSCGFYWRNWRMQKWGNGETGRGEKRFGSAEIESAQAEHAARFSGDSAYADLAESFGELSNVQRNQARDRQEDRAGLTVYYKSRPAQAVMAEYCRRVIPAWRAYGIPEIWHHGVTNQGIQNCVWASGWRPEGSPRLQALAKRGMCLDRFYGTLEAKVYDSLPLEIRDNEAVAAYRRAMRPLLLFLGGPEKRFTTVEHAYASNEVLQKQVVAVNETGVDQSLDLTISLIDGAGMPVTTCSAKGLARQGETAFFPFAFPLPRVASRTEYRLRLTRANRTEDELPIQVFPPLSALACTDIAPAVALYDPAGRTRPLLAKMGISFNLLENLDSLAEIKLLVVGREGLTPHFAKLANLLRLPEAVLAGLNVVVFEQSAFPQDDFKDTEGDLKTASQRRVFIRAPDHPLFSGLSNEDFADWRGASTLIAPYPPNEYETWNYDHRRFQKWGNEGIVTTCVFEKPDVGNFRVLLDSGFDLWQTPLVEYRSGRGRMTFCQLDVTDRFGTDPVATLLVQRLLEDGLRSHSQCDGKLAVIPGHAVAAALENIPAETRNVKLPADLAGAAALALDASEEPAAPLRDAILAYAQAGGTVLLFCETGSVPQLGWLPFPVELREQSLWRATLRQPGGLLSGLGNSDFFWRKPVCFPVLVNVPANASLPLNPAIMAVVPFGQGRLVLLPAWSTREVIPDHTIRRAGAKRSRFYSTLLTNLGVEVKGVPDLTKTLSRESGFFIRAPQTSDFDPDYHVQW